ncbi:hypothetical protein CYLTODRAFT_398396, partial [Cylindrobasidium torrendii FP15055 ss-10]
MAYMRRVRDGSWGHAWTSITIVSTSWRRWPYWRPSSSGRTSSLGISFMSLLTMKRCSSLKLRRHCLHGKCAGWITWRGLTLIFDMSRAKTIKL